MEIDYTYFQSYVGIVAIAKATFGVWIKFMAPLFYDLDRYIGRYFVLYFISSVGWTEF
jgi:hypothetical protein